MDAKQALVRAGVCRRVVHFSSRGDLVPAIRSTFSDLPCIASAGKLVIQTKDEEWEGEFVDLREDQDIPDRSVLNVVVIAQEQQVGIGSCTLRLYLSRLHFGSGHLLY